MAEEMVMAKLEEKGGEDKPPAVDPVNPGQARGVRTPQAQVHRVDLVVISYNTLPLLQSIVRQVQETAPAAHLIIIDNGSTDGSAEWLAERSKFHVPGFTLLLNAENRGFAVAANQGTWAGQAELVGFLNTDVELPPGWLEGMLAAFADPQVMIAGAQEFKPDGTKLEFNFIGGACLVARRWWFEEVGGWDEEYFFGYEDVALSHLALAEGYKIATTLPAIVHSCCASHTAETAGHVEEARQRWEVGYMAQAVLKFTGRPGSFLIGVPNRNITMADLAWLVGTGWTVPRLIATGQYEPTETVAKMKRRGKGAREQGSKGAEEPGGKGQEGQEVESQEARGKEQDEVEAPPASPPAWSPFQAFPDKAEEVRASRQVGLPPQEEVN